MESKMQNVHRGKAFGVAIIAAALWGLSGTAVQVLFQKYSFSPIALVTLRLFIASLFLFIWLRPKWPKAHSKEMILFGLFGILPSQLFYFLSINYANVAVATLLQLLFLPIVATYEIFVHVYKFSFSHATAISLSMLGTVLLAVGGPNVGLHITPLGFVFGLLCAVSAAYYTLASKALTRTYTSWSVTAWGFLVGGLASLPFGTVALIHSSFSIFVFALILFVALCGTLLSYGLYVKSLVKLTGTEASITATGEPIMACVASYVFLGVLLSPLQYLGGVLIIIAIFFLRNVIKRPIGETKKGEENSCK
jgi:drug/metabolite transporter (DMT)-like permease